MASLNSKLDLLLKPIVIEIISWLDQESLMDLSLVSKQLYNIIKNEPGNLNQIHPVFEVGSRSTLTFFQNLNEYFLNTETKNKLQSYNIMRFKDVNKTFDGRGALNIVLENNVQMNGITTLYLSSPLIEAIWTGCDYLLLKLPKFLPNLLELVISNVSVPYAFIRLFSSQYPLLEKVNTNYVVDLSLCGFDMQNYKNLKEINMDNAHFKLRLYDDDNDKMADLKNHQETFIFHRCCNNLERVSIRDMVVYAEFDDDEYDDEDLMLTFTQNLLIKFVRNAPPSLCWFRSDLTQKNITMLQMERPGIELLN
jgi:hypothetical protein